MDFGKIARDTLGQVLSSSSNESSKTTTKKNTKTSSSSDNPLDGVETSVDTAIKSKLPKGAATDIATGMIDQNKDGRIVDDLLRMGESLLKKKK